MEVYRMTATEPVRAKSPDHERELAEYLREEYTFRHDLIWRLLFRVTAVAAPVSIVPFTMSDTAGSRAGGLVKFLPALAIGLVLVSWIVTLVELHLFRPVDGRYVEAQDHALGELVWRGGKLDRLFVLGRPFPSWSLANE